MNLSAIRKSHFNAAHRIYNPTWSDEKNLEVFGLCSNPYFHGHNYEYEVKVTGPVDPDTGYVIDLGFLSKIMKENVEDILDHKNLNIQVEDFNGIIPTAENICILIYKKLRPHINSNLHLAIKLWETPRNSVEFSEST